jgi:hypothetical protein
MSENFLLSVEFFWQDVRAHLGRGRSKGANPVEIRTLVALAATLVWASVAAHATSGVQTAREAQTAPPPASLDEPTPAVPESPPAILGALAADDAAIQIQLGSTDPEPRGSDLLDLLTEN